MSVGVSERPRWNDEPCEARIVNVIVADNDEFPGYWARHLVGQQREAVEVVYNGQTFYLDNDAFERTPEDLAVYARYGIEVDAVSPAGQGWRKVTGGRGLPQYGHRELEVERVV